MALERSATAPEQRLRFTTFKRDEPIPLHVALPVLENMGFKVISERVYAIRLPAESGFDSGLRAREEAAARPGGDRRALQGVRRNVLRGDAENDGFNGLVVSAGLHWREAALVRAFCKYILQTGIRFSQSYMQEVLGRYPAFCRALVEKFAARYSTWTAAARARAPALQRARPRSARARSSREPRRRSNSARVLRRSLTAISADELLPTRGRAAEAVRLLQARSEQNPRAAEAAPEVRDLRLSPSASKACICAARKSRAAAFAGPIGARTSAPRSSA